MNATQFALPLSNPWEQAYLRYQTPPQEVNKFYRRFQKLGANSWPLDSRIVELFCGRGSGLRALHNFGFDHIEGIDISPGLAALYRGPGQIRIADCREIPLPDASRDVLVVHSGLHHLQSLPGDLEQVLAESTRVLRPGGRFVVVEPWQTMLRSAVHFVSQLPFSRAVSKKLDAFAVMNEHAAYSRWLIHRHDALALLNRFFVPECQFVRWGKLYFAGCRR